MAGVIPASGWFPGDNAEGFRVESGPVLNSQTLGLQKGQASLAYSVTGPGTVASAGTVSNNTGVDCMVYAYATGGNITAVKIGGTAVGGSASTGNVLTVMIPATSSITVSYTGTLTWTWLPK